MMKIFGMSRTMRIVFAIALAILIANCGFITVAYAMTNDYTSPEVVVTVVCGDVDEETLANIKFDDGTYLRDYDYTIRYIDYTEDPVQRGSTIPLSTFFESAVWFQRETGISLAVDPIDDVRTSSSLLDPAWELLVTHCRSDPYWANEQVMYWQFMCHFDFAKYKDTWNLEPWHQAENYFEVVLGGCNPSESEDSP